MSMEKLQNLLDKHDNIKLSMTCDIYGDASAYPDEFKEFIDSSQGDDTVNENDEFYMRDMETRFTELMLKRDIESKAEGAEFIIEKEFQGALVTTFTGSPKQIFNVICNVIEHDCDVNTDLAFEQFNELFNGESDGWLSFSSADYPVRIV